MDAMNWTTRKFITIWEDTWHELVRQMRPEETPDAFLRRMLNMEPRDNARRLIKLKGKRERVLDAAE